MFSNQRTAARARRAIGVRAIRIRIIGFLATLIGLAFLSGCGSSSPDVSNQKELVLPPPTVDTSAPQTRTRYALNNQCFALQANGNGLFVSQSGNNFNADAADVADAKSFYMKPAALGKYLFFTQDGNSTNGNLLTAAAPTNTTPLASAVNENIWVIKGIGDDTVYPTTPVYDQEPTVAEIDIADQTACQTLQSTPDDLSYYRCFANTLEPNTPFSEFSVVSDSTGQALALDGSSLSVAAADDTNNNQSFTFVQLDPASCLEFPEAHNNYVGEPFKQPNATNLIGMADTHVHISSSTFLGDAQHGRTHHPFGVTHALNECTATHGAQGSQDLIGAGFQGDADGHNTAGWPIHPEWPAAKSLTHEAIYWKWLERAWASGLRIAVNDVVDNETLCELQRNNAGTPNANCNPMDNAADQVGTMYSMQDYIDAQYGGRGDGFMQMVLDPADARVKIQEGKLAVVLGIEISNLLNCKLTYNPNRTKQPFEEPMDAAADPSSIENTYTCDAFEPGDANFSEKSIKFQLKRLTDLGVRQIVSIHEFDNAFGGNGIFDGQILNLGNRENTGGIPSGSVDGVTGSFTDGNAALAGNFDTVGSNSAEPATGEFWTTYDCPADGDNQFSGYIYDNKGGSEQDFLVTPACVFMGQSADPTNPFANSRRPGGPTPCYPLDDSTVGAQQPKSTRQCNARWMTPMGEYFYRTIMEEGMIFDIDHMELAMKTQALEMAEAQAIPNNGRPYPFVSTHGTFGGTTNNQAIRIFKNGGHIYPSLGNARNGHLPKMNYIKDLYDDIPASEFFDNDQIFGFGFGTDTNGLSAQNGPRDYDDDTDGAQIPADRGISYPYTLFSGGTFDTMPEFDNIDGIVFEQPEERDINGNGRTWHIDEDGSAHFGMLSGLVQEMTIEGDAEQMRHLFNSAELYLRTWERTLEAQASIQANGFQDPQYGSGSPNPEYDSLLRPAPAPNAPAPTPQ